MHLSFWRQPSVLCLTSYGPRKYTYYLLALFPGLPRLLIVAGFEAVFKVWTGLGTKLYLSHY